MALSAAGQVVSWVERQVDTAVYSTSWSQFKPVRVLGGLGSVVTASADSLIHAIALIVLFAPALVKGGYDWLRGRRVLPGELGFHTLGTLAHRTAAFAAFALFGSATLALSPRHGVVLYDWMRLPRSHPVSKIGQLWNRLRRTVQQHAVPLLVASVVLGCVAGYGLARWRMSATAPAGMSGLEKAKMIAGWMSSGLGRISSGLGGISSLLGSVWSRRPDVRPLMGWCWNAWWARGVNHGILRCIMLSIFWSHRSVIIGDLYRFCRRDSKKEYTAKAINAYTQMHEFLELAEKRQEFTIRECEDLIRRGREWTANYGDSKNPFLHKEFFTTHLGKQCTEDEIAADCALFEGMRKRVNRSLATLEAHRDRLVSKDPHQREGKYESKCSSRQPDRLDISPDARQMGLWG